MKKMIALMLALGLVATGCTAKDTEKTEPNQQTETPKQELTKEQEESLWTATPAFKAEAVAADGKKTEQELVGEPGRFGFLGAPFEAGKPNKYIWKFWDKKAALPGKTLTVKAMHKDETESKEILAATLAGPLEGADAHTPSELTLPKAGKWRLDLFVDGKPYGGVIVEVK